MSQRKTNYIFKNFMKFQGDCKKEIFVYHYPIRFYVAVKKRERGAREDPTLPLRTLECQE